MNSTDLFVGSVAGVVGLVILLAGALNWQRSYEYRPARWIEAAYGRNLARAFYVLLGLGLIVLGVAISQGWGFNRSKPGETVWVDFAPLPRGA